MGPTIEPTLPTIAPSLLPPSDPTSIPTVNPNPFTKQLNENGQVQQITTTQTIQPLDNDANESTDSSSKLIILTAFGAVLFVCSLSALIYLKIKGKEDDKTKTNESNIEMEFDALEIPVTGTDNNNQKKNAIDSNIVFS